MHTTDSIPATIADATGALDDLQKSLPAAERFSDSNLSNAGVENERAARREAAISAARSRSASAATLAHEAAMTAEAAAAPHRPAFNGDDVAQLTRVEIAWRNKVVPLLDAGRPWNSIIDSADVDSVLAIEQFARSRFLAEHDNPLFPTHSDTQFADEQMANINALIRARHAALAATDEGREAIQHAEAAQREYAAVNSIARAVHGVTRSNQLAAASIYAKTALADLNA